MKVKAGSQRVKKEGRNRPVSSDNTQTQELCVFGSVLKAFFFVDVVLVFFMRMLKHWKRSCGTFVLRGVPDLTSHGPEKRDLN